jgi:hypothetical protein
METKEYRPLYSDPDNPALISGGRHNAQNVVEVVYAVFVNPLAHAHGAAYDTGLSHCGVHSARSSCKTFKMTTEKGQ